MLEDNTIKQEAYAVNLHSQEVLKKSERMRLFQKGREAEGEENKQRNMRIV